MKAVQVQARHYTFKVTLNGTFVSLVLVNYTLGQYENQWKAGTLAERKHMMVLAYIIVPAPTCHDAIYLDSVC